MYVHACMRESSCVCTYRSHESAYVTQVQSATVASIVCEHSHLEPESVFPFRYEIYESISTSNTLNRR